MKKIISICIASIITLVGCSGDGHEGEAKTPSGSSVQKGRDYEEVVKDFKEKGFKNTKTEKVEDLVTGWLTKDGEVESVSVDGDQDYSPDDWYSNDVEVVITYHTFPEKEKRDTGADDEKSTAKNNKSKNEKEDKSNSDTKEKSNNDSSSESKPKIVTVENNKEFAAVLAVKDEADPIIGEFAKKNEGRTVEFDGYIANMMLHENYKTRYNILILAGDYGQTTNNGPSFQFKDVNIVSDLKLTGSNIPDTIGTGQNLHITARVEEYDEKSGLFRLDPISTEIR
ncbi:DUF4839 domain-containing protein [Rossellomorea vietnamensis]|uniref:DUF4839 domain-containing protein n=1 Tax=Rossellomorea vietnamensis TaxID=218284 RepID=UPI001E4E83CE|nr:DUF4839 domain-containing protein [Rossellomorea vietnamensis]MCC5804112.1 DUF4839 domain-containing protein [Rossellomorea vietnamensis]